MATTVIAYKRRISYVSNLDDKEDSSECKYPLKPKRNSKTGPDILEEMHFVYLKLGDVYMRCCKVKKKLRNRILLL